MTTAGSDDIGQITARLGDATTAARDAYRDTARLIRLLTVLSDPSAPDELLIRALNVLSETYDADVVAMVSVVGDRFLVTTASGLAEDDPSFVNGWAPGTAAARAVDAGTPVSVHLDRSSNDIPPPLADLGLRSAAFVPMSGGEMLVLYRSTGEPFSGTDLHVLASVANRLSVTAEDRERAVAIEYLARSSQLLAPHLGVDSLMQAAAAIMQELTMSDDAWILGIEHGMASQRAHCGSVPEEHAAKAARPVTDLRSWPRVSQGKVWTATALPWAGSVRRAAMCVPVMRDGAPATLLYSTRNRPRPFSADVIEIATIFASHLGSALENAGLYAELRDQATRDVLTGLANRDLAWQRLDQALTRDATSFVGLLFCDLDGFKAVNDRLGHETGDALLRQVAERLQHGLRTTDLLARFGGDEFVAVLGEVESLADVTAVGHRLVRALTEPFHLYDEPVTVSASIGGVLGMPGQTTAGAMLRDADAAMYVAKSQGPGAVEVFDDAASIRSLDRLGLRNELLQARDRGEFEVRYQPLVELETGAIVGFEALLRWNHPRRGAIPPDVFIPLAEETGEVAQLDRWVLAQACEQLFEWQALDGWPNLTINVNLSAVQLRQADVADQIVATIRGSRVRPSDVWLEVTERNQVDEGGTVATEAVRASGVHFALDDFGSSHSNLAYLKQLPAECLKIDKSFVHGVAAEGVDRSIVRAILAMARELGLDVVAEGVERYEQRAALIELGCRMGQGYLFAPALSVQEATRLLAHPGQPEPALLGKGHTWPPSQMSR